MKSEERHKLQQNELADWLSRVYGVIKPYANAILAVILLAVVIGGLWYWWNHQSRSEASAGWDQLFAAVESNQVTEIGKIAEQNPNNELGLWATVMAGDLHLANGCHDLFTNKAVASQDLQKALDEYTKVRSETRNPLLRERAIFGLARTYEALSGTRQSQGELDKAIKNYQELVNDWKDGAYYTLAKDRLEDLTSSDGKKFYDQFAHYDPQPKFSPPLAAPSFDSKTLQEQTPAAPAGLDIKFPEIGKNLGKSTEEAKDTKDSKDTKASPPVKPSTLPALPDKTVPKPPADAATKEPAKK
jgi:predicted negative regulator of RcsB-dependent stress response